jgi:hypothetical protein
MKKLVTAFILSAGLGSCAVPAVAQHHGYHHGYYRGGYGGNWIAPAIIGGVIGYELSRPRYYEPPVIVQQPPVIIQQSPIYSVTPQPSCTMWTETQHADGTITRTRTCTQ